jgi:heterodisulfide reductase subunit C
VDFRPNKLIHLAKLGINDVLKKDSIWLCSACYGCTEICPQGIEVTEVIRVLKNLAVEEGIIPDHYTGLISNIIKTGLANIISSSTLRRRESKGLPPLSKTKLEDISKLAEVTSLDTSNEEETL